MKKIIVLTVISLFLAGCMTVNTGIGEKEISPEMISKIKINETKKAEIIEWFGGPHSISTTAKGQEVYKYIFMKTESKTMMMPFIPTMDMKMKYQELNLTFANDIVVDYSSTRR